MNESEQPARIPFGRPGEGAQSGFVDGPTPEEEYFPLEEELQDEHFAPPGQGKKQGVPIWIFVVAGLVLVIGIGGLGMMVVKMFSHGGGDQSVPMPQSYVPQPVIQSPPAPASVAEPVPAPGQAPAQAAAVPAQSMPPASVVNTQVGNATGQPQAAQAPVSPPPQNDTQPAISSADGMKVAALADAVQKTIARLDQLTVRMGQLEESMKKMSAAVSARPEPAHRAPARYEPPARHYEARKEVTKRVSAPAAPAAQSAPAPSAAVQPAAPVAAQMAAAPQAAHVQGYSISSMIGTRAWLIRRTSDGTETEVSVAPGEKLDGHVVVSVDGVSKQVVLDNGQRIGIGR